MKNVPKHIAIIPDGNRRWAREKNLSSFQGHKKGFSLIRKAPLWCKSLGVEILTIYALSTENLKRSKKELDYLMHLFEKRVFDKDVKFLDKHKIKVKVFGKIGVLPKSLRAMIKKAEKLTKKNNAFQVNFALSYGGRDEIVEVIKNIIKKRIKSRKINEAIIKENLYSSFDSDPDLVIRAGGEKRLSNFLLWQTAYSELYFLKKYWPDFTKKDLEKAVKEYCLRKRRFGR